MRNWNLLRLNFDVCLTFMLPDYLWGIETQILIRKPCFIHFRFQTTYEELKLAFVAMWFATILPASRLPMRNWNLLKQSLAQQSMSLPDYLWGIETRSVHKGSDADSSFQTTYEELKPLFRTWKGSILWCFQTTYEELKLINPNKQFLTISASRLPMRNWNHYSLHLKLLFLRRLPDYLWGIET